MALKRRGVTCSMGVLCCCGMIVRVGVMLRLVFWVRDGAIICGLLLFVLVLLGGVWFK